MKTAALPKKSNFAIFKMIPGLMFVLIFVFFPRLALSTENAANSGAGIKSEAVLSEAEELKVLAQSPTWLKLLHYKKSWLGYTSEIDGPEFYLDPQGRSQPDRELFANYRAFHAAQKFASGDASLPRIECRFPARFAILKRELKSASAWQMPDCAKWDYFRDGIAARSATLVFSSYYLNNPSSAFGHTFIRLNKAAGSEKRHELLDYGVGYAATAGNVNPLTFALGGLLGWFRGDFTNIPYYYKVGEYNDFESRDLWEYNLNLSEGEVQLLVAHFWELANSVIHYQYLTKNCSSLMFTSIEAVAPRLNLMQHLPFWIIPADTVRALYKEPGLVRDFKYRPSKRTQFVQRYAKLNPEEKLIVNQIAKADDPTAGIEEAAKLGKARVLDTLIDYYDYRYIKKILKKDPEAISLKQRVLVARSKVGTPSPLSSNSTLPSATNLNTSDDKSKGTDLDQSGTSEFKYEIPKNEMPELAHPSERTGAGFAWSNQGEKAILLRHRFALHDLLDPQLGYPRDSQIDFLELNLRVLTSVSDQPFASTASVQVDEFYAFGVKSFAPYETLLPNVSWKVRFGAERTWDLTCTDCLASVAGGGAGLTFALNSSKTLLLTGLLDLDASGSSRFSKSAFKLRSGPELNLRAIFTPTFLAQINATYLHIFFQDKMDAAKFSEEVRFSPFDGWSFGAQATQLSTGANEYRLLTYHYY